MRLLVVHLFYAARSAIRGLWASPVTTGVALVTIAVSLVLVGAFGLLVTNMQGLLDRVGEDLRVTAYLEEGISDEDLKRLALLTQTVEGVASVETISKDDALRIFDERLGGRSGLLEGLEYNPLPASLEITLVESQRSVGGLRVVVESLDGLPGIEELSYGEEWVEGYARALSMIRGLGVGVACVLALATLLIVGNTIKLAVYARRDEIEILGLVGASRSFVRIPFLLEGFTQGTLAALMALGLLYILYRILTPSLAAGIELLMGHASPAFFSPFQMFLLVASGAFVGALGSAAAFVEGGRR